MLGARFRSAHPEETDADLLDNAGGDAALVWTPRIDRIVPIEGRVDLLSVDSVSDRVARLRRAGNRQRAG